MYEAPPPIESPSCVKRISVGVIVSLIVAGLLGGLIADRTLSLVVMLGIILLINGLTVWFCMVKR